MHYKGPRKRKQKGPEKIFGERIAENVPKIGKKILKVQEVKRVPYRINPSRNILIKLTKID